MNIFRKFVYMVLIITQLSGCFSTYQKDERTTTETINAFFIANNKLFVIGNLYSYQFEGNEKSWKGKETAKLIAFLQSPEAKSITNANIHYIRQEIGTMNITSHIEIDTPKSETKEYDIEGTIVKIGNQDEILKQHKLAKPLTSKFIEYSTGRKYDHESTELALSWGFVAIIMLPVAVILSPFALLNEAIEDSKK